MTQTALTADEDALQYVTFRLAGESYGLNVMQVQEVLRVPEIAPVPGAPAYVIGIINLRGSVITVIDTRARLALSPAELSDNSRIIILESRGQMVGVLVDSVTEVVYLRRSEIEPTPSVGSSNSSRYISGVYHRDGELLILVDLETMLIDDGSRATHPAGPHSDAPHSDAPPALAPAIAQQTTN